MMKRDMDLIRDLLLKIEEASDKPSWRELTPESDNTESERILKHLRLIYDAGLINCIASNAIGGHWFAQDIELTWEGYDFADSIRDSEVWEKTKKGAASAGGFTVDLLKDLAKGFVKTQIEERTGVKL